MVLVPWVPPAAWVPLLSRVLIVIIVITVLPVVLILILILIMVLILEWALHVALRTGWHTWGKHILILILMFSISRVSRWRGLILESAIHVIGRGGIGVVYIHTVRR
jgi:hypothetical protein